MMDMGRATFWICMNVSCGHIAFFKPEYDIAFSRVCPFCSGQMNKQHGEVAEFGVVRG